MLRILAAVLTGAALLCVARVGPRLLAACLATVVAGMAVAINFHWMTHLDSSVEMGVRPHRTPGAVAATAELWGFIGEPRYFAAAVLACGAWFSWSARSAVPVAVMVAAVGAAVVLEQTLKATVGGTRFPHYMHAFPSGHVTVIGAFVGMTAVCLCAGRRLAVKMEVGVLAAAMVMVVAVLAVYTRAHTFTDAVGGLFLSAAIVAMAGPSLAAAITKPRPAEVKAVAPVRVNARPVLREPVRAGSRG